MSSSVTNYPNGVSSFGITLVGGSIPSSAGTYWFVSTTGSDGNDGLSFDTAFATVQKACDEAAAGDVIVVDSGEYDENVTLSTNRITIVGAGPVDSVRITGLTNGTALTLSATQDTTIINLNLEGRGTGGGIVATGQIRRFNAFGCKFHGGTNAVYLNPGAGGQVVDFTLTGCQIALATNGIVNTVGGGDPTHRLTVQNSRFYAITTDCVTSGGSAINTFIMNNVFANDGDTEPTTYIELNGSGDSGIVAGNQFATATNSNTKFVLDADVMWGANATEAGWSTARPA